MNAEAGPLLTVVSRGFPPQVSGSSILLANLLANYPGKVNAVVGHNAYAQFDPAFLPPCPVHHLAFPHTVPIVCDRLGRRLPRVLSRSLQYSMQHAFRQLGTQVVLAAFPHEAYVVAAFQAARQRGLPFYIHMHDLWGENMPAGTASARFAAAWEAVILRQATRVLCMTETMQKHYEKHFGIPTYLLPHSIREQDYLHAPTQMLPARMAQPTVLFVGAVSPKMNLDALKVLAAASELLPAEYRLLFCTSFDLSALDRVGIRSSRLQTQYVTREEVQRLQSAAHVLIAPLSHKDCSIHEVHTVFSTKLLEYLVAGRPIVVFAPAHSYHAESARKNSWGYVVTEDSPAALAAAIVKLVTDEQLAAELVQGAQREAQARRASYHAVRLYDWVLTDAQQGGAEKAQVSV